MPVDDATTPAAPVLLAWFRAMRPHQWAKNVLVFLPLVAAHAFGLDDVLAAVIAFCAFCLCASATYIVNDLIDLKHDRRHPKKSRRPFASGLLPVSGGYIVAPCLFSLSLVVAATLPSGFFFLLLIYTITTLMYSLALKAIAVVDVVVLGSLYVIRVVAGGAAVGLYLSPWLLAFSLFLFLGLALTKR